MRSKFKKIKRTRRRRTKKRTTHRHPRLFGGNVSDFISLPYEMQVEIMKYLDIMDLLTLLYVPELSYKLPIKERILSLYNQTKSLYQGSVTFGPDDEETSNFTDLANIPSRRRFLRTLVELTSMFSHPRFPHKTFDKLSETERNDVIVKFLITILYYDRNLVPKNDMNPVVWKNLSDFYGTSSFVKKVNEILLLLFKYDSNMDIDYLNIVSNEMRGFLNKPFDLPKNSDSYVSKMLEYSYSFLNKLYQQFYNPHSVVIVANGTRLNTDAMAVTRRNGARIEQL